MLKQWWLPTGLCLITWFELCCFPSLYASAYFTKWLQTISGNQPINSDCIPRAPPGPDPAFSLTHTHTYSSYTFWCWVSLFIIYHAVWEFSVVTSLNYENVFLATHTICVSVSLRNNNEKTSFIFHISTQMISNSQCFGLQYELLIWNALSSAWSGLRVVQEFVRFCSYNKHLWVFKAVVWSCLFVQTVIIV